MANQFRQVLGPASQHEEARLNVEKARLDAERVALDARAATFNTDNNRGRLATRTRMLVSTDPSPARKS